MISKKQAVKMARRGVKRWLRSRGFVTHNGVSIGTCQWDPKTHYRTIIARVSPRARFACGAVMLTSSARRNIIGVTGC